MCYLFNVFVFRLLAYVGLFLGASSAFSQVVEKSVIVSFGRYASSSGGCSSGRGICSFVTAEAAKQNAAFRKERNGTICLEIYLSKLSAIDRRDLFEINKIKATGFSKLAQEDPIVIDPKLLFNLDEDNETIYSFASGSYDVTIERDVITINFKPSKQPER